MAVNAYAECPLSTIILGVLMLGIIMLGVIRLNVMAAILIFWYPNRARKVYNCLLTIDLFRSWAQWANRLKEGKTFGRGPWSLKLLEFKKILQKTYELYYAGAESLLKTCHDDALIF